MTHEAQLQTLLASDPVRMRILRTVQGLALPDCWVAAGFVRSLVWDHLHQRDGSMLPEDIDVIWYDTARADAATDGALEAELSSRYGGLNWSVKNQARMHVRNADRPYTSAADAMTHWPETATAVGVRLGREGRMEISAPLGLEDLFSLTVRCTARFKAEKQAIFLERIQSKAWRDRWPKLIFPGEP
ncbi:nucleotidyltransferase family protein [Pseudomonas entomophila]|uniref:nucleotidyltransferase family protein n=1 Tax=Pseudomonas entomophila TaxID=312306 RepID=UPI0023D81897|nr:nucleotidyltransferase family protein [Pseudomonas entomophila]MDF0729538.1 nucleotidyltransferase family protein [Pseudomonas entomophila]